MAANFDRIILSLDEMIENQRNGINLSGGGVQSNLNETRYRDNAFFDSEGAVGGREAREVGSKFLKSAEVGNERELVLSGGSQEAEHVQMSMYRGPIWKLFISNIHYGISDSDFTALFEDSPHFKSAQLHYNQFGEHLGTGEVGFTSHAKAAEAIKYFNGKEFGGRSMVVRMVMPNILNQIPLNIWNNSGNYHAPYGARRGGYTNRYKPYARNS